VTRDDIHNYLEEGLCASAGGSAGGSAGSSASGRVHNLGLKLICLDHDFDSDIEQAALQRQQQESQDRTRDPLGKRIIGRDIMEFPDIWILETRHPYVIPILVLISCNIGCDARNTNIGKTPI
jgi:hypothetical protein